MPSNKHLKLQTFEMKIREKELSTRVGSVIYYIFLVLSLYILDRLKIPLRNRNEFTKKLQRDEFTL